MIRIAFAAGIHRELMVRLQIPSSQIETLLGLRGQASLDVKSPEAAPRNFEDQVDFRAGGGAIEAGDGAGRGGGDEVFDDEALPTGARHGMARQCVVIGDAKERVDDAAIPDIDFGRFKKPLAEVAVERPEAAGIIHAHYPCRG